MAIFSTKLPPSLLLCSTQCNTTNASEGRLSVSVDGYPYLYISMMSMFYLQVWSDNTYYELVHLKHTETSMTNHTFILTDNGSRFRLDLCQSKHAVLHCRAPTCVGHKTKLLILYPRGTETLLSPVWNMLELGMFLCTENSFASDKASTRQNPEPLFSKICGCKWSTMLVVN